MNMSNSCRTVFFLIFVSTVISDIRTERNFTWFEAQEICQNRGGLTLGTNKSSQFYWTGRYKRITPWIKIKGCFHDSTLSNLVENKMNQKSVGMCQEICQRENTTIFGVKNYSCKCIKDEDIFSHMPVNFPSKCNIECENAEDRIYLEECGGSSFYNIFETEAHAFMKKWKCLTLQCSANDKKFIPTKCSDSFGKACTNEDASSNRNAKPWFGAMKDCKNTDKGSYLFGDVDLQNAPLSCNNSKLPRHIFRAWIGVAQQRFTNTDKGWNLNGDEERSFQKCQMCKTGETCSFKKCTEKIENSVFCAIPDRMVSPVSSSISSIQMGTTINISTSTGRQTLSISRNIAKSTTEQETVANNQGLADDSTQEKDADKGNSDFIVILPIAVVLGILLIAAAVVFFYLRRKNIRKKSKTEKTPVELPSVKTLCGEEQDFSSNSYFVFEKTSQEISNRGPLITESPYNDTEEGEYDHLRDTRSRKDKQEEDTYQHASAGISNDVADYDTMANSSVIKMTEEEGTYDHAHASVNKLSEEDGTYDHAHPVTYTNRNSDYGYNMPSHGSCNDNPYDIAKSKS